MKMIRLSRSAREDLIEISTYFLEHSDETSLARRFLSSFEETARMLARHPQIGREFRVNNEKAYRYFVVRRFHRYLVFYEDRTDAIRVVRVLHGARDLQPSSIKHRM